MSAEAQLFPGIFFDASAPEPEQGLPRMDVASFVGYASSGPLHIPVAIEDMLQFREIFGKDVNLAWDAEHNTMEKSYLGITVDTFFRNGGRRCWIVRVADEQLAQTAAFTLPGMVRTNGKIVENVTAFARSPGSWAHQISVNTTLQVVQLPFARETVTDEPYFSVDSSKWVAKLVANHRQLERGDVLRVMIEDNSIMFLIIDDIISTSYGIQVQGKQAYLVIDNITTNLDIDIDSDIDSDINIVDASPADYDNHFSLTDISNVLDSSNEVDNSVNTSISRSIFPLSSFDNIGVSNQWSTVTNDLHNTLFNGMSNKLSNKLSSVQVLHFQLFASDNNKSQWQLSDLGFTKTQSRFWGQLPNDAELFKSMDGAINKVKSINKEFVVQLTSPRFPLASSFSESIEKHEWIYLPLDVAVIIDNSTQSQAKFENNVTALELDGIENANSTAFIDSRLASIGSDLLKREGHSIAFLSDNNPPLKGIHSLLTIEEATLISVPDAIHRHWHTNASSHHAPLDAPELFNIQKAAFENEYKIEWTAVSAVTQYTLEWSESSDFLSSTVTTITGNSTSEVGQSVELLSEPKTEYYLLLKKQCAKTLYFRVRSENHQEVSVWSNHMAKRIPGSDFVACDHTYAEALAVELHSINGATVFPLSPQESVDGHYLVMTSQYFDSFESDDLGQFPIDKIDIQKSNEFTFIKAEQVFFGDVSELELTSEGSVRWFVNAQKDSSSYYRARTYRQGSQGAWSNTIVLRPSHLSLAVLEDKSDFSNHDILAIHRALLRLCYARGDLFGVLSLPKHYTVQQAQSHFSQLTPATSYDNNTAVVPYGPLNARVYPLTLAEQTVCSHGALYYPWLKTQTATEGQVSLRIQSIPPDGCVLGVIARKSLEQGAWIAPANIPLADILALESNTSSSQWEQLTALSINTIRKNAQGFVFLSADTLSENSELKEINVRRLLSLLAKLALKEGNRYVFEPNSASFQERVQQHFETMFERLYSRGAFAGNNTQQAYRIVTGSSVNTQQSIESGRFIVEIHVAPSHPLKFIRVRLVQSGPNQIQIQEVSG